MKAKVSVAFYVITLCALGGVWAGDEKPAPHKAAIYDADPDHLWNRLHRTFFLHPGGDPAVQNVDAVDPPLWPDSTFLQTGEGHRAAIKVLDEFLSEDGGPEITGPVKRAVLQHDLWSVFDWSAHCLKEDGVPARNLEELRSRLAKAIRKLALTGDEIAALPNNLDAAGAGGAFKTDFDPKNPKTPFLPRDLFDPKGPWVCVRGAIAGPSAPVHVEYYNGRSPFLVFVRLPGGREATSHYLNDLNQVTRKVVKHGDVELPLFPVGTAVALLRQMTVIDTAGEIRVTPLTQTIQMRVYREVGEDVTDHEKSQAPVKFRMGRTRLFAGEDGGLEPIGWTEPLRVSLLNQDDIYHREGSRGGIKTVMQSCIACHSCGGATVHSIFTYKQDDWVPGAHLLAAKSLRLVATVPDAESRRTVRWKKGRYEWGLLKGLLERGFQTSAVSGATIGR